MKFQAVTNGRVYASRGRTIVADTVSHTNVNRRCESPRATDAVRPEQAIERSEGHDRQYDSGREFEPLGRIPNPHSGVDALRYEMVTTPPWRSALELIVGSYQTTNVWPITESVVVASVGRQLFVSHDGGQQWQPTHQLPDSSAIAGVLPTGLCVHDGAIYLGEYPLGDDVSRILRSTDNGRTWTTVVELPTVRHIHALCPDPYTGELWVTTGDRDAECHIGRLRNGAFEPVGGGSQRWRAVDLVFTPSAVLWGMDCTYTDRNRIFRLDRDDLPDEPTRPTLGVEPGARSQSNGGQTVNSDSGPPLTTVTWVPNSVYFGTSLTIDDTEWVVFSTTAETGGDSTAPQKVHSSASPTAESDTATVIAAPETSGFTEWYELCQFRRRTQPIKQLDPGGWLPAANAYVYLGVDPDHGLIVNPFNTATDHGRLITLSPETITERLNGKK